MFRFFSVNAYNDEPKELLRLTMRGEVSADYYVPSAKLSLGELSQFGHIALVPVKSLSFFGV